MIRGVDKWLIGYLRSIPRRPRTSDGVRHVFLCVADHFEPLHRNVNPDGSVTGGADPNAGRGLVKGWCESYRGMAGMQRDAEGRGPRHTFFYPAEEYDRECVDLLADFCRQGHGEVEVHLHHRNDTVSGLREKLAGFRDLLRHEHGLLGEWRMAPGQAADIGAMQSGGPKTENRKPRNGPAYGFVHGNWALCNSRPDRDWCGVNEELSVLQETGCYADFTFPSAPSPTQPRMVNAIYRAEDRPGKRRGADRGDMVVAGNLPESRALCDRMAWRKRAGLMLIQGPLAMDWGRRKWGVLPRLENGEISSVNMPSRHRFEVWIRQGIHVMGMSEWLFVKVHGHGLAGSNTSGFAGSVLGRLYSIAEEFVGADYGGAVQVHYVTAREMYNLARAAEDGRSGSPAQFFDYEVIASPGLGGRVRDLVSSWRTEERGMRCSEV